MIVVLRHHSQTSSRTISLDNPAIRTSTHRMKSSQLRLWFSSVAYNLLHTGLFAGGGEILR